MSNKVKPLGVLMDEYEAEHLADVARREAALNSPAERARIERKKLEEFERGVRLGWYDVDGNAVDPKEDESDDGAGT